MSTDTTDSEKAQGTAAPTERPARSKDESPITFVEFFAGIGGWSIALEIALERCESKRGLEQLAMLDHSDLCTRVLQHNHGEVKGKRKRSATVSIEKVTIEQVHSWNALVWAMSPPCQPHTRQHENQQKEMKDPRSQPFLRLLSLLDQMDGSKLPQLIFMENVVGFEASESCKRWREVLSKRSYKVGHFHLNPTQVGIPNDRPRYYCIAVMTSGARDHSLSTYVNSETNTGSLAKITTAIPELGVVSDESDTAKNLPPISKFLDDNVNVDALRIPTKVLESKTAWCFDIVTPQDRRSACFTSSYGRLVRGTGSVLWRGEVNDDISRKLQLQSPEEREYNDNWSNDLNLEKNLRYFSGEEVARLMGFDDDSFSFPDDITLKQQWKLLGNSLNVRVAARLCELGLQLLLEKLSSDT